MTQKSVFYVTGNSKNSFKNHVFTIPKFRNSENLKVGIFRHSEIPKIQKSEYTDIPKIPKKSIPHTPERNSKLFRSEVHN